MYRAYNSNGDVFARGKTLEELGERCIERLLTHAIPTLEILKLQRNDKFLGAYGGAWNINNELVLVKL